MSRCGIDSPFRPNWRCLCRPWTPRILSLSTIVGRLLQVRQAVDVDPDRAGKTGFDLRTYYCAACEATEVIIAAIHSG